MSDHRGSAEYRLAVSQTLLEKFFHQTRRAEAA
jgi:xanthine dehydrogenase iron-sulfur cluster and FAD-binding subunit A